MDMDMEKDPPILPELSVLPRERLMLIQMLIPTTMVTTDKILLFLTVFQGIMDPTTIIHINHFHIIHHLKEKDQSEDTLPILSELSRFPREKVRMLLYIIHIDMT